MNDKQRNYSLEPPHSPTSRILDYQLSETITPKWYIFHLMLKNECPQTFRNDVLTYIRRALHKLDQHFTSNRRQIASFRNAQPLCIETWVRVRSLKIILTMVLWPKIDALRTFIFNEVSIIGKTPRGRKLQPSDLCGLKIIESWIFHFSKQKRSTTGQTIWNYSLNTYSQKIFLA